MQPVSIAPGAPRNEGQKENKMITITANIPARKLAGRTYAPHTKAFQQSETGQWFIDLVGDLEKVSEAEVIDVCRRATNGASIKAAHFQMDGFHSAGPVDNTPSHKADY
jgi:hypothetical protein